MNQPSAERRVNSPQNPYVKGLVALRKDGTKRREEGCFLLEGRRAVAAALAQDRAAVREAIYCEKLLGEGGPLVERARVRGVPLVRVSKDVFKKIAGVMSPQGVAAVIRMPDWMPEELWGGETALLAVACGLQDPGNLGTLIRSCEAAGAAGLIVLEGGADPFNAKVVRATAAALLHLPVRRMSTPCFLEEARERDVRLIAASAHQGTAYRSLDWTRRPLALCIGSEGEGLPKEIEAACTEKVRIPLGGKAESLNAAVAASILLFEARAGGNDKQQPA